MAAECYWCVTTGEAAPEPPLGACSDCWVFACQTHAERDLSLGKWQCFGGIAKLLSVGAGFDEGSREEGIASLVELNRRFPRLAAATADSRTEWEQRGDVVANAAEITARDQPSDVTYTDDEVALLANAVGMVRHFLPETGRTDLPFGAMGITGESNLSPESEITGQLGDLLHLL